MCVCNLSPIVREHYRVGLPFGGGWTERINTDAGVYGGGDIGNGPIVAEPLR